jgi:acyl dehydratase
LLYTQEELAHIYALYEHETIRGKEPRYWEDIAVGTALPTLVKGPMTVTGFIAYAQGWGGLYIRAHKLAYQMISRHPGLGIPNKYGIPDGPERVHWEPEFAQKVGAPGAYDYGPERCSWLSHAMTNWIGDDGMLHTLRCEIRRHNPEGDTLFIHGSVTNKYTSNGKHYVECALVAENQEGALSAHGTAVAQLPSKTG